MGVHADTIAAERAIRAQRIAWGDNPKAAVSGSATAASPASGWRRVFGDCATVSGATAICHAVGVATSLLLRMLLTPAQMGIWQALKLLLSYGNYANLGISKGAAREYAVALGRGDTLSARRGLNLAFTVNTLSSLLYAAVLVGVSAWVGWTGTGPRTTAWAVGLGSLGGLAVLSRYVTFHVTLLRTKQRFATVARLSVLEAVATLLVCGLATWRWGLFGLYGATLAVLIAAILFVVPRRAVSLAWAWDRREIGRLLMIGGPILLAGSVSSLFRSLDKLMILAYATDCEFQLGCYSAALLVTAALYGFGNMLSMVMGPRYAETFGRSGSRSDAARLAARATELQAAAMALPAGLAIVLAPPLLAWLLPDYRPGLPALAWLAPGAIALSLALPAVQYLIAVGRQRRALWAVLVATGLAAVGNHWALTRGYGLEGVAAATAASYLAYLVLTVSISLWRELGQAEQRRYLAMVALGLMPTLLVAMTLVAVSADRGDTISVVALKTGAVLLAWAASASAGWRLGGWSDAIGSTQPLSHVAAGETMSGDTRR